MKKLHELSEKKDLLPRLVEKMRQRINAEIDAGRIDPKALQALSDEIMFRK